MRQLVAGSVFVRTAVRLYRSCRLIFSADFERPDTASDVEHVVRVADSSLLVGCVRRSFLRVAAWWSHSRAAFALERWMNLQLARRIRLAGVTLATAVIAHLILTRFSAPSPTWFARGAWIVIVAALLLLVASPAPIAAAWLEWTRARRSTTPQSIP